MKFFEQTDTPSPDIAVLFASYEDRCLRVATELAESGYQGSTVVLHCDDLGSECSSKNVQRILGILPGAVSVPVSFHDPIPAIRAAEMINWERSVLIDISCFNRGNLFPFLWSSRLGVESHSHVLFAYSSPEKYGSWLTLGYEEPHNIVGFPGGTTLSQDRILLCIVGYESERALQVIRAVEPSSVVLTVGSTPTKKAFLKRNKHVVEEVHGSSEYNVQSIDVSDPGRCLRDIEAILNSFSDSTAIHVAPFSTKLSCIAVWAYWLSNPDLRVWNAQPKTYNQLNYSKGSSAPRYFGIDWTGILLTKP